MITSHRLLDPQGRIVWRFLQTAVLFVFILGNGPMMGEKALGQEPLLLTIEGSRIETRTEWVEVTSPLITQATVEVVVTASSSSLGNRERLRIAVEVENGPSVVLADVQAGDSWENVPLCIRSPLGSLAQASVESTRARFAVEAASA